MNLYIVRHAEAVPLGRGISRDADRPLSAHGERDAAVVGRVLALADPAVRTIPAVRSCAQDAQRRSLPGSSATLRLLRSGPLFNPASRTVMSSRG